MPWAPVNGIRLYYQVDGSGPPLVFAHGAGGNHLSWCYQAAFFAGRYRCITYDHRAFGLSPDLPDGPGRRSFADDLAALLDFLGIERAAIVAQSMGGRSAVGLALRRPEIPAAIVLAGTHGGAVNARVRRAQEQHRASRDGRRSLGERALYPGFIRRAPELAHLYRAIGRLNPPRPPDFLALPPDYRGSTARRLAALDVPVLFLAAEHDAIMPPQIMHLAQRLVRGSQFDVIPAAGHSAYFERPDEFNERVLRFLLESGWC